MYRDAQPWPDNGHTPDDFSAGNLEQTEWRVGKHILMHGDSELLLDTLKEGSIDLIVTSPPYNIGVNYSQYDDTQSRESYLCWIERVAKALQRVLSPAGSIFLNVSGTASDPWVACDVANRFRSHFVLQNNITWIKSISIGERTSGHFKPLQSRRFLNHNHESLFHFTKSGMVAIDRLAVGVPFEDKSNIARRGHSSDRRCAGNTWFVPYQTIQSKKQRYYHPAPFPEALVERCIMLHGGCNLCVLDPFMGTGTTLVVANRLGHRGVGIDIDSAYVEAARSRLTDLRDA
jgi:site-specific DNA-methyltransferase (adenine-specific)